MILVSSVLELNDEQYLWLSDDLLFTEIKLLDDSVILRVNDIVVLNHKNKKQRFQVYSANGDIRMLWHSEV